MNSNFEITCENRLCDNKIFTDDTVFSIPLTEDWAMSVGSYCSQKCALDVNWNMVSNNLPRNERQNRDQWMKVKWANSKNEKSRRL